MDVIVLILVKRNYVVALADLGILYLVTVNIVSPLRSKFFCLVAANTLSQGWEKYLVRNINKLSAVLVVPTGIEPVSPP